MLSRVAVVATLGLLSLGCPGGVPAPVLDGTTPPSPTNADAILVFGTARPRAVVRVYGGDCGGTVLGQAAALEGSGVFSVPVIPARNTTTVFRATATVGEDPTSPCSNGLTFVHDAVLPEVVVTGTSPASPSNQNTPEVLGQTEPRARVRVYDNLVCLGAPLGEALADAAGNFRVRATVPENATTALHVAATDPAGNPSGCTYPAVTYVEDSVAPAPPVLVRTLPASPSRVELPSVEGNAESGALVRIFSGASCAGTALAEGTAAGGGFAIPTPISHDAVTVLSATAQDPAGNTTACGPGTLTYVHDGTPPAPPVLVGVSPPSPSRDRWVILTGTADSYGTVTASIGAGCTTQIGSVTAEDTGGFYLPVIVPDNATTVLNLRAVDAVGNASSCGTPSLPYTHDDRPPSITWIGDGPRGGATVDGGTPSDIDYQRQTDVLAAHWDAIDYGSGIARYEYSAIASTTSDGGALIPPMDMGLQTSISTGGLSLAEDRYQSGVRAVDVAGNESFWTWSDGVSVDLTSPAVSSVSPADGEPEVALGRQITILLTEDVDFATVTNGTVRLLQGADVVDAGVSPAGAMIALSPVGGLTRSGSYRVDIQAGITDMAGNAMAPSSTAFTAARFAFEGEQGLQAESVDISDVRVATGADGSALALWAVRRGLWGPYEIWAARAAPGASFGTPLRLDNSQSIPSLALAVEAGGDGWAAWTKTDAPYPDPLSLMVRRFEVASGWQTAQELATDVSSPRLAEGGGHHVLGWIESAANQKVARWSAGSGWSAPVDMGAGDSPCSVAVDAAGRAVLVWQVANTLRASRSAPGGPWGAAVDIDTAGVFLPYLPMAGIDSSGTTTVAWRRRRAGSPYEETAVMFSRAPWGSAFATPAPIAIPSGTAAQPKSMHLAVASDGTAMAVWNEQDSGSTEYYASRWSGTRWEAPQAVGTGLPGSLQLARDESGRFIASYIRTSYSGYSYQFTRYLPGFGWPYSEEVTTGSFLAGWWNPAPVVSLAGVGDGRAVFLYTRMSGSYMNPFARAYR